jgi:hypothetical protein
LEVEVVGVPAAGEHGVQLLPGLLPGQQAVHGVGGDALRSMDGGGVAETGRLMYVIAGQPDGQVAAGVSHGQVTVFGDVGDVGLLDVAEDAAGADRGELLIITDKSDTPPGSDGELDGGVEGEGVGHARFIDDHQSRRSNRCRPIGQLAMVKGPGEFGECVGADPGLLGEDGGRGSRGGEADHLAAFFCPGEGQGAHGSGFASAGGSDRELQTSARRAHLPDDACPASRGLPFAAISSNARSTAT